MKSPVIGFACLVLAWTLPALGDDPVRYRFTRPLDRAASQEEAFVSFTFDGDIYAATRDGWPDLRILNDAEAEAPYDIEPVVEMRSKQARRESSTEVVSLQENGGTIEVQLRLPDKSPAAEGFAFATPLIDYVKKVRVFGSHDATTWTPLVTDGVIFDYSRFMDVSRRELAVPKNSFRSFKFVVENITDQRELPFKELARTLHGDKEEQRVERTTVEKRPFRIDRIAAFYHVDEPQAARPKVAAYPVEVARVTQDAEKKQTVIELRSRREPLTSLKLVTPDHNFHRRAVVEVSETYQQEQRWASLGAAAVWNFHFRDDRQEQLAITFPETRRTEYRIVIFNEDNPPLEIKGVEAEGNVYRAVFSAKPSKTYHILYGSAAAKAPRYETATVLAAGRGNLPVIEAPLGKQTALGGTIKEPAPDWHELLNNWYFLGGAICLMVAVLGWGLFRAGQRLETLKEE